MKNEKLRIEDFLNNELKNQTKIIGGSNTPIVVIDPGYLGGGPSVTGTTGSLEQNPTGSTGPKVDPNKMN